MSLSYTQTTFRRSRSSPCVSLRVCHVGHLDRRNLRAKFRRDSRLRGRGLFLSRALSLGASKSCASTNHTYVVYIAEILGRSRHEPFALSVKYRNKQVIANALVLPSDLGCVKCEHSTCITKVLRVHFLGHMCHLVNVSSAASLYQ